jgi:O-antigen ligase
MTGLHAAISTPVSARWKRVWLPAAAMVGIVAAVAAALPFGSRFGQVFFLGVAALAIGVFALRSPVFTTLLLFVAMFLLLPIRSWVHVPTDAYKIVFALLVVGTALWMNRTPDRLRGIGAVEWAMCLYVMWNVYSMVSAHEYSAGPQVSLGKVNGLNVEPFSVPSFIGFGVVIPLVCYVVGRYTFDRMAAVRAALWMILALAAYSAAMSILPVTGPTALVWPQYILHDPRWVGRAVGVMAQPVENGMVLVLGFAIAVVLASWRTEPAWRRRVAFVVAVACGFGIYLTHTRAVWLSAVIVLIIGATLAKGFRTGFIAGLGLTTTVVVVNWSVFTSTDRKAGGVGSLGEIWDRLNINQTALWAIAQKPLTGWGIGRFYSVNMYHHQQWSIDTPWRNGWADAPHENELGILAELGFIGLAFWLCVLALIAHRLWRAYRTLPESDLCGQPLAVIAIMAFAILLSTGIASDLRFFGFPMSAIFLLVGAGIGWSDRHKFRRAAACGDIAEQVDIGEQVQGRHARPRLDAFHREFSP